MEGKQRIKRLLPAMLIIAAGVIVYWNSFDGVFVYDDLDSIRDNPHIRQLWPLSKAMSVSLWSSATTVDGRPLLSLTFALNYALFGSEPWGYHLVNLLIHIGAGLLLFGVLRRILQLPKFTKRYPGKGQWLALAVSLIWLVHPLHTESVTYIVQRAESLMGLLFLLTLYCSIRGFADLGGFKVQCSMFKVGDQMGGVVRGKESVVPWSRGPRDGRGWLAAAVIACAIGMGVKQTMFAAPLIVLLYDWVFVSDSFRGILMKRRWFYTALFSTWLIVFGIIGATWKEATIDFVNISPIRYLVTQPMVLLHYLRLSLWPSPLVLDYGWPLEEQWPRIVFPGLLIVGMLCLMFRGIYRRQWYGFVLAWFFLILAPTSSISPTRQAISEHRMYLSLAALVLSVVLGVDWIIGKLASAPRSRALIGGTLTLVTAVGLGCMARDRNRDYHSALGIWQKDIIARPRNALAHLNMGNALQELGRYGEAFPYYLRALQLNPGYAEAHYNWGVALDGAGRTAEAITHYRKALQIKSDFAEAHNNLSHALLVSGQALKAVEHGREALRINPGLAVAHFNLGNALQAVGRSADAVNSYKQALIIRPDYAEARMGWGNVLLASGHPQEAIEQYRKALRMKSDYAEAHYHWGMALEASGLPGEAGEQYREAIRIKPRMAEAYLNLGNTLLVLGHPKDAIDQYEHALRIKPGYVDAKHNINIVKELAAQRESDR